MSKRFQRVDRRQVQITTRDLAVVEAVFAARYMTHRQIGRLFFGGDTSSHGRQRVRYLFDLDYLRKRVAAPNEPDIYYLGLEGRRYIASLGCVGGTHEQGIGRKVNGVMKTLVNLLVKSSREVRSSGNTSCNPRTKGNC